MYRRALRIEESKLGGRHREVAVTLSNLASMLRDRGE